MDLVHVRVILDASVLQNLLKLLLCSLDLFLGQVNVAPRRPHLGVPLVSLERVLDVLKRLGIPT